MIPGTTTLQMHRALPAPPRAPRSRGRSVHADALPPRSLAFESMALLRGRSRPDRQRGSAARRRPPATIYDPVADRFEEVGARSERRGRSSHAGRWTRPGRRRARRGRGLATTELFDPRTGTFARPTRWADREPGASATRSRQGASSSSAAGRRSGHRPSSRPVTGTFTPTGPTTVARGGLLGDLLPDGRVLIAGGVVPNATRATPDPTATAEVYDPATGTFTGRRADGRPAGLHAASSCGRDRAPRRWRAVQPVDARPDVRCAEIFDPATGTFRATGSLTRPPLAGRRVRRRSGAGPRQPGHPGGGEGAGASTEWFQ